MQNQNQIRFVNGEVVLSQAAYHELRMFCLRHGETDLPETPIFLTESDLIQLALSASPGVSKVKFDSE